MLALKVIGIFHVSKKVLWSPVMAGAMSFDLYADSYEMTSGEGSRLVFSQPDGSIGTSRKVFLTQILDRFGNALTLTYDASLRIVALTRDGHGHCIVADNDGSCAVTSHEDRVVQIVTDDCQETRRRVENG